MLHSTVKMSFDGYALGGVSVGEEREEADIVVSEIVPLMPADKPRYLMGVGLPSQLLHGISAGVDMFDCVLPTRMARNGTLFTSTGRLNITNSAYSDDPKPLDESCQCFTCRKFSRAYLAHLYRTGEPGVLGLLSIHNLAYYQSLVEGAREAIAAGKFSAWKAGIESNWMNESQNV